MEALLLDAKVLLQPWLLCRKAPTLGHFHRGCSRFRLLCGFDEFSNRNWSHQPLGWTRISIKSRQNIFRSKFWTFLQNRAGAFSFSFSFFPFFHSHFFSVISISLNIIIFFPKCFAVDHYLQEKWRKNHGKGYRFCPFRYRGRGQQHLGLPQWHELHFVRIVLQASGRFLCYSIHHRVKISFYLSQPRIPFWIFFFFLLLKVIGKERNPFLTMIPIGTDIYWLDFLLF